MYLFWEIKIRLKYCSLGIKSAVGIRHSHHYSLIFEFLAYLTIMPILLFNDISFFEYTFDKEMVADSCSEKEKSRREEAKKEAECKDKGT